MTDPYLADVVLGMHFDGANGSTAFTDDATGKTITVYGGAQISTSQSAFGGASGYFNGTDAYLSVPHSADLDLASGNFTIEAWIYLFSYPIECATIISKDGLFNVAVPSYYLDIYPAKHLRGIIGNSAGLSDQIFEGGDIVSLNTWHQIGKSVV